MPSPHIPKPAFSCWAGPRQPQVLLVGEAFGEHEAQVQKPFVGWSGKELFRMLGESAPGLAEGLHASICKLFNYGELAWLRKREEWLNVAGVAYTNTFNFRPSNNSIPSLCLNKAGVGKDYPYEPIASGQVAGGKYLDPQYFGEVTRLWEEIDRSRPNLVVPLGNTACWALLGSTKISQIRGTTCRSRQEWEGFPVHQVKCLPTYHPASVLYNWSQRPIAMADLGKMWLEARGPELTRPARHVKVFPTLAECQEFLEFVRRLNPPLMAADIETKLGQITTISFAPAPDVAFVIPFWDQSKPGWSYWSSLEAEAAAWSIVEQLLQWPIVGQNFIYDLQYLTPLGLKCNPVEDTMLLHHSLFPEMPKSLGFLGSIYTHESSWKLMKRVRATDKANKKDE